jgi:hypothetical protein
MPRPTATTACCSFCGIFSLCLLVFFHLHAQQSTSLTPWKVVFAPLSVLSLVILLALFTSPWVLPPSLQPTQRTWATWGPAAVGALTVTMRLTAMLDTPTASATSATAGWASTLSPFAAMLLLRACTLPPVPPVPLGAPEASGVLDWRRLQRLELPLGGCTLALLYWQLEHASPMSWWLVVAPALVLDVLTLAAGVRSLGSLTGPPSPPPPDVEDAVEWVRHREWTALGVGCEALVGAVLRLSLLCTFASQLGRNAAAPSPAAAGGSGGSGGGWSAAYFPYALLLSIPLCCCACCALFLPPAHVPRSDLPLGHAHANGHSGDDDDDDFGHQERVAPSAGLSAAARRRAANEASSGGSEGTSPLLSGDPSPHLL